MNKFKSDRNNLIKNCFNDLSMDIVFNYLLANGQQIYGATFIDNKLPGFEKQVLLCEEIYSYLPALSKKKVKASYGELLLIGARMYFKRKIMEDTVRIVDLATKYRPDSGILFYYKGCALFSLGKKKMGEENLIQSFFKKEKHLGGLVLLSNEYIKQKRIVELDEIYQKLLFLYPNDPNVLNITGVYFIQKEKNEKGHQLLLASLALNKKNVETYAYLGYYHIFVDKDYEKAKSYFKEGRSLNENNFRLLDIQAMYYDKIKDYKSALKCRLAYWSRSVDIESAYFILENYNKLKMFKKGLCFIKMQRQDLVKTKIFTITRLFSTSNLKNLKKQKKFLSW